MEGPVGVFGKQDDSEEVENAPPVTFYAVLGFSMKTWVMSDLNLSYSPYNSSSWTTSLRYPFMPQLKS
jgi:hypothetical protein